MHKITNPYFYITPVLVEQCLKLGGLINKLFTGIGFTFSYSNIINNSGKPDILIVPNIQTATDKRKNKEFAKGKNVLYFYSGSEHKPKSDYSNVHLIVCVADSYYHKELYKIPSRYTLLDEIHTAVIQADFRPILYKLFEVLKTKQNVSYVTATLYVNDVANVKIVNTNERFTEQKNVYVSDCYKRTLAELKKAKGRILIASNEARKTARVLKDANINEVGLIAGKGFRRSFFKHAKVNINNDADVTIMTTRGFEGHDVMDKDVSIFVFQNYDATHVQFFDAQLVQVLGRARLKPKYLHINWGGGVSGHRYSKVITEYPTELIEICTAYCDRFNARQKENLNIGSKSNKKERFESEDFQFRYKNKQIRLGSVRKFIIYDDTEFKNEKRRIAKVNHIACDVVKNKLNIHSSGLNLDYFNEHGYDIIKYPDKPYNLKIRNISNTAKTKNLIWNRENNPDYISSGELIKWSFDTEDFNKYKKTFDILKEHLKNDIPTHIDYFFRDFKGMECIFKHGMELAKESYRAKRKAIPPLEHIKSDISEIVKCFLTSTQPKRKIRAFRNYNSFTSINKSIERYLYGLFDLKKMSFDITRSAPTILQRLADDKVCDVYEVGEKRKQSKTNINMLLNSIYYTNDSVKNKLTALKKTKFSDKTFNYIKDNFYRTGQSDLLINTYTYHERDITEKCVRKLREYFGYKHLVIIKHDEINIYFNDVDAETFKRLEDDYGRILSSVEHLGHTNWFGYVGKENILNEVKATPKTHQEPIQLELNFMYA